MNEENLKPCPFCGKTPTVHRSYGTYAVLHSCDAIKTNIGRGSLKAASEKWNTRAFDIDEIKAALEECHQAFRDRKNGRVAQAELRERLEQIFEVYYE